MTIIAIDECYDATKFKSINELVRYADRCGLIVDPTEHNEKEGGGKRLTAGVASKQLKGYALYLREEEGFEWRYKVQRV